MRNEESHLVVDGAAAVLEDDLADGVGGGEQGVVGEAVGGEDPVEVGHQGGGELRLCHQQELLSDNHFVLRKIRDCAWWVREPVKNVLGDFFR